MDIERQTYIKHRCSINDETECWEWSRSRTAAGYGKAASGKRGWIHAHRVSFMAFHGDIPAGMFICHRCDNPCCVNPDHLFLGTPGDNSRDMTRKRRHGRWTKPENTARGDRNGARTCPESRTRGADHHCAQGTMEQANEILGLQMFGYPFKVIAVQVGLPYETVKRIARGEHWLNKGPAEVAL